VLGDSDGDAPVAEFLTGLDGESGPCWLMVEPIAPT
jgi:hypothetical protein